MSSSRRLGSVVFRRKKKRGRNIATIAGLVFFIVLIARIDKIIGWFEPGFAARSTAPIQLDASGSNPLITNAFKLGHGLTQLQYSETDDLQYIKWRNRTITHLVALGIKISIIHKAIDDGKLSPDETAVLRDQIHEKILNRHGKKAASTFLVGAELFPVTQAIESYIKDEGYREKLAKSNVSIHQFGSLLNTNLDQAEFPNNLKIDLASTSSEPNAQDSKQSKLDRVKKFREDVINYFYDDKGNLSSSEMLALSSAWFSNSFQDKNQSIDFFKDPSLFLQNSYRPIDYLKNPAFNEDSNQ